MVDQSWLISQSINCELPPTVCGSSVVDRVGRSWCRLTVHSDQFIRLISGERFFDNGQKWAFMGDNNQQDLETPTIHVMGQSYAGTAIQQLCIETLHLLPFCHEWPVKRLNQWSLDVVCCRLNRLPGTLVRSRDGLFWGPLP